MEKTREFNLIVEEQHKVTKRITDYIDQHIEVHGEYKIPSAIANALYELPSINVALKHNSVWSKIYALRKDNGQYYADVIGCEEYDQETYTNMHIYNDHQSLFSLAEFIDWYESNNMTMRLHQLWYELSASDEDSAQDYLDEWVAELGGDDILYVKDIDLNELSKY